MHAMRRGLFFCCCCQCVFIRWVVGGWLVEGNQRVGLHGLPLPHANRYTHCLVLWAEVPHLCNSFTQSALQTSQGVVYVVKINNTTGVVDRFLSFQVGNVVRVPTQRIGGFEIFNILVIFVWDCPMKHAALLYNSWYCAVVWDCPMQPPDTLPNTTLCEPVT